MESGSDNADSRSAQHAGSRRHNLGLRPHLRHSGAGHLHNSALRGNWRNRLPRKQRHGPKHHMDSESGCEGNGSGRDGYYRERSDHGGTPDPNLGQQHSDGKPHGAVTEPCQGRGVSPRHASARSRILPLGVPNPERRRPHGSFPRGQHPTASICVTPPLLTDVRAVWRCANEIPDLCQQYLCHEQEADCFFQHCGLDACHRAAVADAGRGQHVRACTDVR